MNSPLPSRSDAWELMRNADPPAWVLDHVARVEALAVAMADAATANGHDVERELVQVGAILHDYGRATTQGPSHAHAGAERLRELGLPDRLIDVVERHTGAGLQPKDAEDIGIPVTDYTPTTLEQEIVAHADNLISGPKRFTLAQVRAKYEAQGLTEAFGRIEALHARLCDACGVDLETLAPADLPPVSPTPSASSRDETAA